MGETASYVPDCLFTSIKSNAMFTFNAKKTTNMNSSIFSQTMMLIRNLIDYVIYLLYADGLTLESLVMILFSPFCMQCNFCIKLSIREHKIVLGLKAKTTIRISGLTTGAEFFLKHILFLRKYFWGGRLSVVIPSV